MNVNVSVIIPSTGRPVQLVKCIEQLRLVSPQVEIICVIEHDQHSEKAVKDLPVITISREEHRGPVYGWNEGAALAKGNAFVLGADDLWFYDNWLDEALKALAQLGGSGMVGLNPLHGQERRDWADHYLVTKDYCQSNWGGVLVVPHYTHYCLDVEATRHAKQDGRFIFADKALAEHRHHTFGLASRDQTYGIGDNYHVIDWAILHQRQAANWPVDYEAIF